MIRLTIVTVLLAVALVVVKRRGRRGPQGEGLRVTSRTGISRGVMAAVLEVEQRRFLVTITPTSTTLVAELGADGVAHPLTAAGAAVGGSALAAAPHLPGPAALAAAPVRPAPGPSGPVPAAVPAAAMPAAAMPAVAVAPGAALRPPTAAPAAPDLPPDASFLDRIRARTLRTYDPTLVGPSGEGR